MIHLHVIAKLRKSKTAQHHAVPATTVAKEEMRDASTKAY
jgi:hypothetical protein